MEINVQEEIYTSQCNKFHICACTWTTKNIVHTNPNKQSFRQTISIKPCLDLRLKQAQFTSYQFCLKVVNLPTIQCITFLKVIIVCYWHHHRLKLKFSTSLIYTSSEQVSLKRFYQNSNRSFLRKINK